MNPKACRPKALPGLLQIPAAGEFRGPSKQTSENPKPEALDLKSRGKWGGAGRRGGSLATKSTLVPDVFFVFSDRYLVVVKVVSASSRSRSWHSNYCYD